MEIGIFGLIGIVLALLLAAIAGASWQKHSLAQDLKALEWYEENIQRKNGWSSFNDYGNYNLLSVDGGKNWYAIKNAEKGGVEIIGPAETIFPGLLKHLQGWDELAAYVEKNGTITHLGSEETRILNNAGFTIKPE